MSAAWILVHTGGGGWGLGAPLEALENSWVKTGGKQKRSKMHCMARKCQKLLIVGGFSTSNKSVRLLISKGCGLEFGISTKNGARSRLFTP